jgi:hypothetical protein
MSWGRDFKYIGDDPHAEKYQGILDKIEDSFEGKDIDSKLTVVDVTKYIVDDNKVDLEALAKDMPRNARGYVEELIEQNGPLHDPGQAGASYLPSSDRNGLIFLNLPGEMAAQLEDNDPYVNAYREMAYNIFENDPDFDKGDFHALKEEDSFLHEVGHHLDMITTNTSSENSADIFSTLYQVQSERYSQVPELADLEKVSLAMNINNFFDASADGKISIGSKYLYAGYLQHQTISESAELNDNKAFMEKDAHSLHEYRNDAMNPHADVVVRQEVERIASQLAGLGIEEPNERAKFIRAYLDPEQYGDHVEGMVLQPGNIVVSDLLDGFLHEPTRDVLQNFVDVSQQIYGPNLDQAPPEPKSDQDYIQGHHHDHDHEQAQVMEASEVRVAVQQQFEGGGPTEVSGDPSLLQQMANYVPGLQSIVPVPNSGAPAPDDPNMNRGLDDRSPNFGMMG